MSVQQFLREQRNFIASMQNLYNRREAWLLRANPVWGRCEDVNNIALFDTEELGKAYIDACKLKECVTTKDSIIRSFIPGCLLYDYNDNSEFGLHGGGPMVIPCSPCQSFEARVGFFSSQPAPAHNPTPPTETPSNLPAEWPQLVHPVYGKDYDVGFLDQGASPGTTDMSHVVPS